MGWEGREAVSPPGAAAPSWRQPASRSQVLAPPSKHLGIQVKPCQPHTCRGVTAQVLGAGAIFKGWGCRLCPEVDGSRELSPCLGSEGGRVRARRDPGPQQHGGVLDVCPQSPSPCPPSAAGEPMRVQGPIPPPPETIPMGWDTQGVPAQGRTHPQTRCSPWGSMLSSSLYVAMFSPSFRTQSEKPR